METQELLKKLGYQGNPESQEEIDNFLNTEIIHSRIAQEHPVVKELLKKEHGRAKGAAETAIKRTFRDQLGVDLSDAELQDAKLDDLLGEASARIKDKISALEAQKGGASSEEIGKLQKEIDKYKGKLTEQQGLFEKTKQQLEEKEKEFAGFRTNLTKSQRVEKAWEGVKLVEDKYKVKGFKAEFAEKYKVELAEEGDNSKDGLIIKDAQGNRVTMGNDYATLSELLAKEASDAGVLKKSDSSGVRKPIDTTKLGEMPEHIRKNYEKALANRAAMK